MNLRDFYAESREFEHWFFPSLAKATQQCIHCGLEYTDELIAGAKFIRWKICMAHTQSEIEELIRNQPNTRFRSKMREFHAKVNIKEGCNHEYVVYTGYTDVFEHCKHCGMRK
jgi:hypothetical protein